MTDAVARLPPWMLVVCGFIYDEAQGLPEEHRAGHALGRRARIRGHARIAA